MISLLSYSHAVVMDHLYVDLESFHVLQIGVNIGVKYRCKKGSVATAKIYTDFTPRNRAADRDLLFGVKSV